jgi:hypothetical protein
MPLCRVGRRALDLERFSALQPSLRHPDPRRPARRVARKLGHLLAVGGVSQEFLGRVHGLVPPGASSLGESNLGALSLGALSLGASNG